MEHSVRLKKIIPMERNCSRTDSMGSMEMLSKEYWSRLITNMLKTKAEMPTFGMKSKRPSHTRRFTGKVVFPWMSGLRSDCICHWCSKGSSKWDCGWMFSPPATASEPGWALIGDQCQQELTGPWTSIWWNNNNSCHSLTPYCFNTSHTFFSLSLQQSYKRYYYLYHTDEETETQRDWYIRSRSHS